LTVATACRDVAVVGDLISTAKALGIPIPRLHHARQENDKCCLVQLDLAERWHHCGAHCFVDEQATNGSGAFADGPVLGANGFPVGVRKALKKANWL
jgi:hypothetical protein